MNVGVIDGRDPSRASSVSFPGNLAGSGIQSGAVGTGTSRQMWDVNIANGAMINCAIIPAPNLVLIYFACSKTQAQLDQTICLLTGPVCAPEQA